MSWIAVAVGGASLISGLVGSSAASSAANQQAAAARNAQNIAQNEFNTITSQESPFMQAGYGAQNQLNYLLGIGTPGSAYGPGVQGTASSSPGGSYGSLLTPFTAQTMAKYSPAYNFQMQQGRQGVLNGDASGAGALSGSAQKDLIGFNQNFANTAFSNAFNQYQTQTGNIYSRLAGLSQLGQNAAANTGYQGATLAGTAANAAQNYGTALAGGTVGAANAWSGAINGLGTAGAIYASQGAGGNQAPATYNGQYSGSYGDGQGGSGGQVTIGGP